MKKLSELMPIALEHQEVLRAARAQAALRKWDEVVGGLLADKTYPDRFDRGTLWVSASGSAWAQELRMREELIVDRLNSLAAEQGLFEQIRVGVRSSRRAYTG